MRLVQADRRAARYAGLVNAVLRRVTREAAQFLSTVDTTALDTPQWLMARWEKNYWDKNRTCHRRRQLARAGARSDGEE